MENKYTIADTFSSRLLFFLFAFFLMVAPAGAQKKHQGGMNHKEVREFRIKYVAQEIGLKDNQQKQFVELYNRMLDERRDCFSEVRRLEKSLKEDKNPSEASYKALSDAKTAAQAKAAEITRRYDEQFSKFLTQKQILQMKEAEERFRQRMIQMCAKKDGQRR